MRRGKIEFTAEILGACDNRSITEIVDLTRINSATVSVILGSLLIKGFIVRTWTRELIRSDGTIDHRKDLRDRYLITDSGKVFFQDLNHVMEIIGDK